MNKKFILLFISFILLAGCSNKTSSQPTQEQILPIQKNIQDWTVSMTPKPSKNDLPIFEFELTYTGSAKATQITVETGNAMAELPSIEKNQSTRIESSYSSDVKQVVVAVSWKKGGAAFKQTVQFDAE